MREEEISVSEAAEKIGVSRSTVLRMIDDDEFDARRKTRNGPWLLTEESVDEFIAEDEESENDREDDYARGHDDGYKEGLAACDLDDEDEDDLDDDDEEDDD